MPLIPKENKEDPSKQNPKKVPQTSSLKIEETEEQKRLREKREKEEKLKSVKRRPLKRKRKS